MKQVFDWMREKINKNIEYNSLLYNEFPDSNMSIVYKVQLNAWKNAYGIVNEAVAKWNEDVCEWKLTMSGYESCRKIGESGHLIHHFMGKDFKHCPYCGKKIKVVRE